MRTRSSTKAMLGLAPLFLALLIGCGGHHHRRSGTGSSSAGGTTSGNTTSGGTSGGGTATTQHKGRLHLLIDWPGDRAAGRTAQALHVMVVHDDALLAEAIVQKPQPELTLPNLDPGERVVQITAHADAAAATDPIAQMYVPVTVTDEGQAEVHLSLTTELDHLVAKPVALALEPGASKTITVTSIDASGKATLVKPTAFSFVSSAPAVAKVDAKGKVVAGSAPGAANVTITEADSDQKVTVPLTVIGVAVSATNVGVVPGGTYAFGADTFGLPDGAVAWSVEEADGGTIDASGLYHAPTKPGTYHIRVASAADPSRFSVATVVVAAGSTTVSVH